MANIVQQGAPLNITGVANSPFSLTVNFTSITTSTGASVAWSSVTNPVATVLDNFGNVVATAIPQVTSPSNNNLLISWTAAQTTAISNSQRPRWSLEAMVASVASQPLLAGTLTFVPSTFPNASTSTTANLSVVTGGATASLTVSTGGPNGIGTLTSNDGTVALVNPSGPSTDISVYNTVSAASVIAFNNTNAASVAAEAYAFSLSPVFPVAAPTGVASVDAVRINAAVTAASVAGGGIVELQLGKYVVSSAMAQATSTVTSSASVGWSYTGTAPSVGQYVIGIGVQGRAPKILTVTGSGFTTDIAPGGTVNTTSIWFVTPAILLPDAVMIVGQGSTTGDFPTLTTSPVNNPTLIYDSGTGITLFDRGGDNEGYYASRKGIKNVALRGTSTVATFGTNGTTAAMALFSSNNSVFLIMEDCDVSGYWWYGVGLDYNTNSFDCLRTFFSYLGYLTANFQTAAIGNSIFTGFSGGSLNLYDVWGRSIYGSFYSTVNSSFNGQGSVTMTFGTWFDIRKTSWFYGGVGVCINGPNSSLVNCFGDQATVADVFVRFGYCQIVGGTYVSPCPTHFWISGAGTRLGLVGPVYLSSATTSGSLFGGNSAAMMWDPTSTVTWDNVQAADTVPFLASWNQPTNTGGSYATLMPTSAGAAGMLGATSGVFTLPNTVTVTTNAGTVPVTSSVNNFTNSSAAAMTITMATSGATDGQHSEVRIFDATNVQQNITFVNTENSSASVPAVSNASTTSYRLVEFEFNGATTKWRCIRNA